jgi:DNA-binding SARP family transcriptional activator
MSSSEREEISLEFWPDSSVERVRSNFHTTLYRTRRAVGENVIIFKNDLYMINPTLDIWCDAKQLEILTNQARLLPLSDVRAEDLWRRAVNSYHGDFLASLDARWISAQREIYNEMYIEALIGTGNCARARKDYQAAIRTYRHCLKVDPYREDAHRALMKCYADLGEKNQILIHYKKLEELFEQELGVKPSMQTIELAEKLVY